MPTALIESGQSRGLCSRLASAASLILSFKADGKLTAIVSNSSSSWSRRGSNGSVPAVTESPYLASHNSKAAIICAPKPGRSFDLRLITYIGSLSLRGTRNEYSLPGIVLHCSLSPSTNQTLIQSRTLPSLDTTAGEGFNKNALRPFVRSSPDLLPLRSAQRPSWECFACLAKSECV